MIRFYKNAFPKSDIFITEYIIFSMPHQGMVRKICHLSIYHFIIYKGQETYKSPTQFEVAHVCHGISNHKIFKIITSILNCYKYSGWCHRKKTMSCYKGLKEQDINFNIM